VHTRVRIAVALCAAVLLGLVGFATWQFGVPLYQRSQAVPPLSQSERLALPAQVYDPPPYVHSTAESGPPGPVGVVFRGRSAREGLTGRVREPWYAVSARTGAYRRLDEPHLAEARSGVWVCPQGTALAWAWPGGIQRYDTMTGQTRAYPVGAAAASGRLAWSPDSSRIAYGRDPVRVLDVRSGDVTELPLTVPPGSQTAPAWTPDGRWVTVVADGAVEAVAVGSGERRTVPVAAGSGGVGGFVGADWNGEGDVAGMHRQARFGRNVLRVVSVPRLEPVSIPARAPAEVADVSPAQVSIEGFLGWASDRHAVLTGLRAETGPVEQAMVLSTDDGTVSSYMQFPTLGDNWGGLSTVSVAADLLRRPSEDFENPTRPWSPGAKLLLCLLLAVFPTVYYVIARRPRST
jgi:hypothetical protein